MPFYIAHSFAVIIMNLMNVNNAWDVDSNIRRDKHPYLDDSYLLLHRQVEE
jgi:hypothetical protein